MSDAPNGKRDFFISFNRADRAWATWIAWVLEETGYLVLDRGARISGTDTLTPIPVRAHAMRTDSGRPNSSIRFRARTATATSTV